MKQITGGSMLKAGFQSTSQTKRIPTPQEGLGSMVSQLP